MIALINPTVFIVIHVSGWLGRDHLEGRPQGTIGEARHKVCISHCSSTPGRSPVSRNAVDSKVFIDTALPFGLWPAPQSCSMHLQMHWNRSCELGVAACSTLLRLLYHSGVSRIRQVCSQPLVSTVDIRRVGCPSTCLPFLGIEVDTMAMETWPPLDKFQHLKLVVAEWHHCKSCWERNWDL